LLAHKRIYHLKYLIFYFKLATLDFPCLQNCNINFCLLNRFLTYIHLNTIILFVLLWAKNLKIKKLIENRTKLQKNEWIFLLDFQLQTNDGIFERDFFLIISKLKYVTVFVEFRLISFDIELGFTSWLGAWSKFHFSWWCMIETHARYALQIRVINIQLLFKYKIYISSF
jgi:hypothetical protein